MIKGKRKLYVHDGDDWQEIGEVAGGFTPTLDITEGTRLSPSFLPFQDDPLACKVEVYFGDEYSGYFTVPYGVMLNAYFWHERGNELEAQKLLLAEIGKEEMVGVGRLEMEVKGER